MKDLQASKEVFGQLADIIIKGGARKAVKYISPTETVKATRQCYGGKIDKRAYQITMLMTVGRPNYEEREFIKVAKQAGEPFPIKKIQIKWPKT